MFYRRIIKYMAEWKQSVYRKPLILRGARQVGKTSVVRVFAEQYFKYYFYINLEEKDVFNLLGNAKTVAEFEQLASIHFNMPIVPGETLIFIDEIQESETVIKLLRFFYEKRPELHVIAAGSLLEVKIAKAELTMPVGRVEYVYLYPLDFFEYLEAHGQENLVKFLEEVESTDAIPQGIHQLASQHFKEYSRIGGMPETVKRHVENTAMPGSEALYSTLLTVYAEDVYKYATTANARYLQFIIEQAPNFAGVVFTYEKFGDSEFRSREMSHAFDTLQKAMVLYQVMATTSVELPLTPKTKRAKKLLFLDIGLVNFKSGILAKYLNKNELASIYRGRIAEQITGQLLMSQFQHQPAQLYYWTVPRATSSTAELDFCINRNGNIYGVEVKPCVSNRLRSLMSFSDVSPQSKLVRIYDGELKQETATHAGKNYAIQSIPFYLAQRMFELA